MADCNAAAHERERERALELVIQLRLKHYEAELRKEKLEFELEALDAEQKGGGLIQRGRLMALEDARNAYGGIDAGEMVAQHLYLWLSELEQGLLRDAAGEFAPGEVVIDSGPISGIKGLDALE